MTRLQKGRHAASGSSPSGGRALGGGRAGGRRTAPSGARSGARRRDRPGPGSRPSRPSRDGPIGGRTGCARGAERPRWRGRRLGRRRRLRCDGSVDRPASRWFRRRLWRQLRGRRLRRRRRRDILRGQQRLRGWRDGGDSGRTRLLSVRGSGDRQSGCGRLRQMPARPPGLRRRRRRGAGGATRLVRRRRHGSRGRGARRGGCGRRRKRQGGFPPRRSTGPVPLSCRSSVSWPPRG